MKRFLFLALTISLACLPGNGQDNGLNAPTRREKGIFSIFRGKAKASKPASAKRAVKRAAAKKRRQKKEWSEYVDKSQQRAYDIQSPEVKDRIDRNRKETADRDKAKRNKTRRGTRRAERKYN